VTKQNIRKNIKAELERALNALSASVLLFDNGFFNDAVSRLYYFVLHNIRALLLTKGLEPKSHEGALRLFGLNFVKEGIFRTGESHIFSKMMKFREEADYNPAYFFTREDFILFKKEAEELADKIKAYLGDKGYL
jgi:uncharacterized protein (UPF0332 family)